MPLQPTAGVTSLFTSFLPFVLAGDGTIGLNGSLNLTTAIGHAYPEAYLYFPAGALYANSSAGWYFTNMSSTTVGTVYNVMYTSGMAVYDRDGALANTGIVSGGPGGYTQTLGSAITAWNDVIPGNVLADNDGFRIWTTYAMKSASDHKTGTLTYGALTLCSFDVTTSTADSFCSRMYNRGTRKSQFALNGVFGTSTTLTYGTVDSTAEQAIGVALTINASTANVVLEGIHVQHVIGILPGSIPPWHSV